MPRAQPWSKLDLASKLLRLLNQSDRAKDGGHISLDPTMLQDLADHARMLQRWAERTDAEAET